MDESANKGLELKGRDVANRKSRDIGRISVTGYDTGRSCESVERELKKFYVACGEITDVYIPIALNSLWHCAFIYFVGEGAVDKALQLNGTDMGGWTLSAAEYPFAPDADRFAVVAVGGYDNSHSVSDIKCELSKLFSSCGKVNKAIVLESSHSLVFLEGENIAETAPKLSGAQIGGRKVVVRFASHPEKSTLHSREDCIITGPPERSTSHSRTNKEEEEFEMTFE